MKSGANNKLEWKHNPGHVDRRNGGLDKHKKPQGHVWVCQDKCGNFDLCLHAWMENELLFSHWLENKKNKKIGENNKIEHMSTTETTLGVGLINSIATKSIISLLKPWTVCLLCAKVESLCEWMKCENKTV